MTRSGGVGRQMTATGGIFALAGPEPIHYLRKSSSQPARRSRRDP
jgi:hypothetical protein